MRASVFLIFFLVSLSLRGQNLISFPFLNRHELGQCPVCEIKDSNDLIYLSNFEHILDEKFGGTDENQEQYLRKIQFVESILKQTTLTNAVRVKLLNTVIDWYCLNVIDNYNEALEWGYEDSSFTVYNNALALANELINFAGPLKIIQLYDQILALPLDDLSLNYYRNLKLAYCAQSRIIKLVNDGDTDWMNKRILPQNLLGYEREVAQNFLNTMTETSYNPFVTYKAISPGINTSIGKEFWYGFEFSYSPREELNNPFIIRHPFLGYRMGYRGSLLRFNLLVTPDLSKKDLLFTVMDYHLTDFLYMNPFQIGWHLNGQNNLKIFSRPELGFHYGIFTLTYSYNWTYDEELRPFTEKHMVNFTISYPLFKLGSFY